MSARLLMNIVHGHLSAGRQHNGCKDRCVDGCGWLALDEWLAGPVTKSDELADEIRERNLLAVQQQLKAVFGSQA